MSLPIYEEKKSKIFNLQTFGKFKIPIFNSIFFFVILNRTNSLRMHNVKRSKYH